MYGIPSMKLDKIEKVLRRIKLLQQAGRGCGWRCNLPKRSTRSTLCQEGIVFKCNTEVGRDVSLGGSIGLVAFVDLSRTFFSSPNSGCTELNDATKGPMQLSYKFQLDYSYSDLSSKFFAKVTCATRTML